MTLTNLTGANQVFCRMPLGWDLSGVFLRARLGFLVWEEDHRGKGLFSPHHTKGICHHHACHYRCWPWSPSETVCVGFLHYTVVLPLPFPNSTLYKEATTHLMLTGCEVMLYFLSGAIISICYLDFFYTRDFPIYLLFICSIIYTTYTSLWPHGYLFHTLWPSIFWFLQSIWSWYPWYSGGRW